MPLPIVLPILTFLGLAIFSEFGQKRLMSQQRSIEACTADIQAVWIKENGVIRVYHEIVNLNCARIVVECTDSAPNSLPGEIDGYPILARIKPQYGLATGASGIRGMPAFHAFTPAQQDAMRRDEAAQGLRSTSVSPPG